MDSKILLGKILQKFSDLKTCQVKGYNSFGYLREAKSAVWVCREAGEDTPIPFKKILAGIEAYKSNPELYDEGPGKLRDFNITHITSPVWSLLHLLGKDQYRIE